MAVTSILNSVAANTALLNLENTIGSLNNVQSQISTGLKVQSAADNAAYYSISSVLNSDSSALSSVSDSLNLGNSSLSVASNAISQIQTTLNDIKSKLVEATQPNANMATIQASISQDQLQLQNISNSANFNGQNFLSVNSSAANYNATQSFVSSYSRNSTGNISIGYINVNTANSALFDSGITTAASSLSTSLSSTTKSVSATGAGITLTSSFYGSTKVATQANGLQTFTIATGDPSTAGNAWVNTISVNSSTAITGVAVTAGTAGLASTTLGTGDTIGGIATGTKAGTAAPAYNAGLGTLTFYVANNDLTTAGKVEYDKVVLSGYAPPTGNGVLDKTDSDNPGKLHRLERHNHQHRRRHWRFNLQHEHLHPHQFGDGFGDVERL